MAALRAGLRRFPPSRPAAAAAAAAVPQVWPARDVSVRRPMTTRELQDHSPSENGNRFFRGGAAAAAAGATGRSSQAERLAHIAELAGTSRQRSEAAQALQQQQSVAADARTHSTATLKRAIGDFAEDLDLELD